MRDPGQNIPRPSENPARDSSHLLITPQSTNPKISPFPVARALVQPSLLPDGDSIQAIKNPSGDAKVWYTPVSTIVALIATTSPVPIEVVAMRGARRKLLLNPLDAIAIWPGTMYRLHEHEGELIRLQRNMRNVVLSPQPHPAPASGVSLFSPQRSAGDESLSEILPASAVPGFEVSLRRGLTFTENHFHKTFDEAYLNRKGELRISLRADTARDATAFDVPEGGCLSIPKRIQHQVTSGSVDNEVLIFHWPRFLGQKEADWHAAL